MPIYSYFLYIQWFQLQVQTESESTSPDEVELNSATEISTDSEFDNDEIIRQAPKIFIDDTHLRKPTKVQVGDWLIILIIH